MFSIIKTEGEDIFLIKDRIEKISDFLEFSTLYNKKNFEKLIIIDEINKGLSLGLGDYQISDSQFSISVYHIENGTSWFKYNIPTLKYNLKLIKNNIEKNEEIKKIASNSNMLLELSHACDNTEYNIDDHLPNRENEDDYSYMWLIFDNQGVYLTICKSLKYCQEFIRSLSPQRLYYPNLSEEDDKLMVVSLSFNGDKMFHHAVKVKILKNNTLNIKSQVNHWKNKIKDHIHKFIIN